jgi:subtilisin family serine protease
VEWTLRAGDLAVTNTGPKVAIIDSGVHEGHPHVEAVAGGVGIDATGATSADYVDRLGHGTAVAAVIREKAPAAELLCIKVFDHELRTTGDALVAALRWARSQRVDIVNLSLGTSNPAHEATLAEEVAASAHAGIIIVSAAADDTTRWLPGAISGVVAVRMDMTLPRDVCEIMIEGDRVSARSSGYPRPIPGVPPERNLKGVSFAVANVTGLMARAWPNWKRR